MGTNNGDTSLLTFKIFPNPTSDFIAKQIEGIIKSEIDVRLTNANGVLISKTQIRKGQTIGYFDIQSFYSGVYYVTISSDGAVKTKKIMIER